MRKIIFVCVLFLLMFSLVSCGFIPLSNDEETGVDVVSDGEPETVVTTSALEAMTSETDTKGQTVLDAEIPLHLSELPDGETPLFAARVATVSGAVVLCNAPEQSPPYTVYWLGRGVPMAGDGVYFPIPIEVPEGIDPDTVTLLSYIWNGGGSGEMNLLGMAEKDGVSVYLHYYMYMADIFNHERIFHCVDVSEEPPIPFEQLEEMVSDFIIPLDVLDIYTPKMELG